MLIKKTRRESRISPVDLKTLNASFQSRLVYFMRAFSVGMNPISSLIAFKNNGGSVTIGRVNRNQNQLRPLIFTSNDPPPVGRKNRKNR